MSKKPPRDVTTEERRLWQFFTRNDKKLHADAAQDVFDIDDYAKAQSDVRPVYVQRIFQASDEVKKQLTPLKQGDYAGVDRRNAQRLKKGKMAVDHMIDLHGCNQMDAFERLHGSLMQAVEKKQRVMLVITGKGNRGEGVLKQNLPLWLNAPAIRPFVLAFDVATLKDGGGGAFYVLLKRQR